jgi:DNA ligase D-like protein (predicted polymerase)
VADAIEFEVGEHTVRVSSPDKPYFPDLGITKSDVVRYFLSVGDGILGALRDRPTTLERWPGGVFEGAKLSTRADNRGDAFYQKRVPKGAPSFVETARITFPSGRPADEVCPTALAVVVWAANLGTLTFHTWPVRDGDLGRPDRLQVDLDPSPGRTFADIVTVAMELRALLDELGMSAGPKTSGSRGLHVLVPIAPRWTFTQVRRAAIALGRELVRRLPDLATVEWFKKDRGARVYFDYNQVAATVGSAYSVRATPRGTVSAPLTWAELADAEPVDFDVRTMRTRFAEIGDRHAWLDTVGHDLTPLLELADRDERAGLPDLR